LAEDCRSEANAYAKAKRIGNPSHPRDEKQGDIAGLPVEADGERVNGMARECCHNDRENSVRSYARQRDDCELIAGGGTQEGKNALRLSDCNVYHRVRKMG